VPRATAFARGRFHGETRPAPFSAWRAPC
jgi:hypothetical protein